MEQIIRVRSTNAFSDSNIAIDSNNVGLIPGGHHPMNQKIVDFKIHGNSGIYDLSQSYMVLNARMVTVNNTADAAAINGDKSVLASLSYDTDGSATAGSPGQRAVVPHSSLVRNIQMYSQSRGMIESVRRQNLLKNTRYNIEKSPRAKFDDPYSFNKSMQDMQQVNNTWNSSASQIVGVNTNVNQVVDTNGSKRKTDFELRIPLHSILDFARIDEYDTAHYGETSIHMELAMDKLVEVDSTFDSNYRTQNGFDGANPIGQCDNKGAGAADAFVTLSQTVLDPDAECPFYVGQQCDVQSTNSVGPATNNVDAYITQISFDHGGVNQAPPTNSKKITLFFNKNVVTAAGTATAITVAAKRTDEHGYDINFAELVLVKRNDVASGPKEIDYTRFTVQEDNAIGLTTHKKTYFVEGNCQTLFIVGTNSAKDIPNPANAFTKYRMAVNGVDVAGNRDIEIGSSLHRERIARAYKNRGVRVEDERLATILNTQNQEFDLSGILPMSVICETMPLTAEQKLVEVEITGAAALDEIILYKELAVSV